MGAFLLAFGLVSGIVSLAWRQTDDPSVRRYIQRTRLRFIAGKPDAKITLDQAEDGLVLARHHGDKALVMRFGKLVASLRKRRSTP